MSHYEIISYQGFKENEQRSLIYNKENKKTEYVFTIKNAHEKAKLLCRYLEKTHGMLTADEAIALQEDITRIIKENRDEQNSLQR